MDKLLFRLITIGEDLYISFYDTSTIGNSRNFVVNVPKRIDFHELTENEYMSLNELDLIPDSMKAALLVGDFDSPVFAVNYGSYWATSYIKEIGDKWIGHQPVKHLNLYRNLINIATGIFGVMFAFWILG